MKQEKFLEKARSIHGYRYQYPTLGEKVMQMDIIDVQFEGEIYKQRVLKHFIGNRPERKTIKKTTEEFITNSKKIWGEKYDYSLTEYKDARTKLKIIHNGIVYEQFPNSHLIGYPVEGFLDQNIFIQKSKNKWGEKYDYSLVDFKNANTKVKILLNGIIYEQTPHNHLKYAPEKAIRLKTGEDFINESKIIHENKYSYENSIYKNDREKLIITCPKHGDFTQRPNHHLKGVGCPTCNESQGEKKIAKFLNKHKINFLRQHRFKDIINLRFDFYIPSAGTCIEFDGIQHFQPIPYFGGIPTYETLKTNDKIKSDYCEENYINLIRIRYDEQNIEKILQENLKILIK